MQSDAGIRHHRDDEEDQRHRDDGTQGGEPLSPFEEDESDRNGQKSKGLEGERHPEPPPGGTRAFVEGGGDPIEHRPQSDEILGMPAQGDGRQRDRHHAEDGEATTDIGDPHAGEPPVAGTDGEGHATQVQRPGHPEGRRVEDGARIGKREVEGQPGDRSDDDLERRGCFECPVEHVDVPVATGKRRVGRVGPVLPEVPERGDPEPFAEPAHDGGVEHGERHGPDHRHDRHPKRYLPAAEGLGHGHEGSSPAPPSADAGHDAEGQMRPASKSQKTTHSISIPPLETGTPPGWEGRVLLVNHRHGVEKVDVA